MHHSSSRLPSSGTTCSRSRVSTLSSVPSFVHASKKFHTVFQGPYSAGSSRHGAPVRTIQNMALRSSRRSRGRRPVRKLLVGNRSSTNSHCVSVKLWRGTRVVGMSALDHKSRPRPRNRPFPGNGTKPSTSCRKSEAGLCTALHDRWLRCSSVTYRAVRQAPSNNARRVPQRALRCESNRSAL